MLDLVPNAKYPLELVEVDLNDKDCWGPAVNGCSYVFHVASPFPPPGSPPKDENECIVPAVNGVINVFTASSKSGTVKRVVLTGSTVAIKGYGGIPGHPSDCEYTEEDWMPEENTDPYVKSKIMAERAAWDFMNKLDNEQKFELVVVNPSLIQGPILSAASGIGSAAFSTMLLEQKIPMWNICVGVIDVRDVATAEIAAMFTPSAAGKRFILACGTVTGKEFSKIVKDEFEPHGYTVSMLEEPSIEKYTFNNSQLRNELGVTPRPIKQAIIDTCYSMIDLGFISKSPSYFGRPKSQDK